MSAFISTFLTLFGKNGIKALVNALVASDMFKDFVTELLLKRVSGIKEQSPELYQTVAGYAEAVASIPAIFTDDNDQDFEQIAVAFRLQLKDLESNLADVGTKAASLSSKSRAISLKK